MKQAAICLLTFIGFVFLFELSDDREFAQNVLLVIIFSWLFINELTKGTYSID